MILLKHLGIYCMDAKRVTDFYINVFNMKLIVDNQIQDDDLIQDLLSSYEMGGVIKKSVKLFKVITEKGCLTKEGDMLEFIQLENPSNKKNKYIYETGQLHICIGIDNINKTTKKIKENGGTLITNIHYFPNGNKCCFAKDIEGNFLELIEKGIK